MLADAVRLYCLERGRGAAAALAKDLHCSRATVTLLSQGRRVEIDARVWSLLRGRLQSVSLRLERRARRCRALLGVRPEMTPALKARILEDVRSARAIRRLVAEPGVPRVSLSHRQPRPPTAEEQQHLNYYLTRPNGSEIMRVEHLNALRDLAPPRLIVPDRQATRLVEERNGPRGRYEPLDIAIVGRSDDGIVIEIQ